MAPPITIGKFDNEENKTQAILSSFNYLLKKGTRELGIHSHAMIILSSLDDDLFIPVASKAGKLDKHNKRWNITSRDVKNAIRLLLPAELANNAISKGTDAINNK